MSLHQVPPTVRNDQPQRTTYTSNVTSVPIHTLTGRDPDETESPLTGTLDSTSEVQMATTKYSKPPSGKFKFSLIHLRELF